MVIRELLTGLSRMGTPGLPGVAVRVGVRVEVAEREAIGVDVSVGVRLLVGVLEGV